MFSQAVISLGRDRLGNTRRRTTEGMRRWKGRSHATLRVEALEERQMMMAITVLDNALAQMPVGLVADSYEVDNTMSQAKAIYVTDSDDNQSDPNADHLRYYEVRQSNGAWYLQNFYGSNSWYIGDVTGLARRPASTGAVLAGALEQLVGPNEIGLTKATEAAAIITARDEFFRSESLFPPPKPSQALNPLAGDVVRAERRGSIVAVAEASLLSQEKERRMIRDRCLLAASQPHQMRIAAALLADLSLRGQFRTGFSGGADAENGRIPATAS